ncbi:MAG: glycosyltransferase family 9 protein [Oligoflexia bacterium]|nr:glycosyltransferase family 9 protein [Oligoflexia bacterium]
MKRRYPDKSNVLLVNITRLGDMLQATPTIAGMKQENPNCKITVVVEKQFEDVCYHIPNIDEVRAVDLGMTVRSLSREADGIVDAFEYVTEVVDDLRAQNFDYCLNMSSSAYTALLLKLVGIKRNGGWTSDEEGYRVIESDWARLFASSVFHQNRQFNSLNLVDVFRCSADVDQHPQRLLMKVSPESEAYCDDLLREAAFTAKGPLIAIQAGASQEKRQWAPEHFIRLIKVLETKLDARIVLVGSKKELKIIDPIKAGANSPNVFVAAGRTSIPQLAALLKKCELLVTGDTGPMHMSVAVGRPVVAMFLASAYGFETGPYSEGNLVLQPVIGCGPCNPNKPCAGLECHDTISPELVAELVALRVRGDVKKLPDGLADPKQVIVYRSFFDRHGFCDLEALNSTQYDTWYRYRQAYRKVWLEDLAGFDCGSPAPKNSKLSVLDSGIEGIGSVVELAQQGTELIQELMRCISDVRVPAQKLGAVNAQIVEVDRRIEQVGFHHPPLGPVTRLFCFAKENLSGTDALSLASQMKTNYDDLARRCQKLSAWYS